MSQSPFFDHLIYISCGKMAGRGRAILIDPEWSPTALVTRRLRDSGVIHASRLAERTTVESLLTRGGGTGPGPHPSDEANDDVNAGGGGGDGGTANRHPLAYAALMRSSCPQPPLDDAITGGGSSVSCDVHFSGMNVRLDPLERCAPHRIVVPQTEASTSTSGGWGGGDIRQRGEIDGGAYDAGLRSATWNAITALSTLCEEVHELDMTFQCRILPSLVLFSAKDDIDPCRIESKCDILDEEAHRRRESALLARIGKFLPALQLASNGTSRLRRLIRNMVVQLGAVRIPSAAPPSSHDEYRGGERGNDDVRSNLATSPSRKGAYKGKGDYGPPVIGPGTPMFRLGKSISIALRILVAVDSAISFNSDLQEAWLMYKDVVMDWSEQKRKVSFFTCNDLFFS
jgi:hypothetical protein